MMPPMMLTVELYNNYYICVILHARSHLLQVLLFIKDDNDTTSVASLFQIEMVWGINE